MARMARAKVDEKGGAQARSDRPGVGELYGIAINAAVLELDPGRESALDRVCEMGYARIAMAFVEGEGRVAGELAPWLWRAGYGRDRGTALVQACVKFREWLVLKPYFAEIDRADPGVIQRFAECTVEEWLSHRCVACGGGGWQEVSPTGKRVRPSGRARNAPKAICLSCRGSGKPKPAPKLRMRVLGGGGRKIPGAEYFGFWHHQFRLALTWLREISARPREHLHAARKSV